MACWSSRSGAIICTRPIWAPSTPSAGCARRTGSHLQDLLELHEQWVAAPTDSVREQLTRLADDLVIPYSVVLTEEAFSDETRCWVSTTISSMTITSWRGV